MGPSAVLLFSALAAAAPSSAGESGWRWRETLSPHFLIRHEAAWLPPGLSIGVEKIHSRLRMDLGMFSPGMAKERLTLFVYADRESYLAGEFSPPSWSNGLAIYERKAVAVPAMRDPRKLLQVLAHETTHLLFDGYWRERRVRPPAWVNEGLAMLEEADSPEKPETSRWYQGMAALDSSKAPPLEAFFRVTPAEDLHDDQSAVGEWYVQAYSVVHFLLRRHSRLQFKAFCGHLRDGRPVADALWLAYRYRTPAAADKAWRAWLSDPIHKRRVAALGGRERDGPDEEIESRARRSSSFKPYKLDDFSPGRR